MEIPSLKYILKGIDTIPDYIGGIPVPCLKYILKGIDTTDHKWNKSDFMRVWNISLKELIHVCTPLWWVHVE